MSLKGLGLPRTALNVSILFQTLNHSIIYTGSLERISTRTFLQYNPSAIKTGIINYCTLFSLILFNFMVHMRVSCSGCLTLNESSVNRLSNYATNIFYQKQTVTMFY